MVSNAAWFLATYTVKDFALMGIFHVIGSNLIFGLVNILIHTSRNTDRFLEKKTQKKEAIFLIYLLADDASWVIFTHLRSLQFCHYGLVHTYATNPYWFDTWMRKGNTFLPPLFYTWMNFMAFKQKSITTIDILAKINTSRHNSFFLWKWKMWLSFQKN